MDDAAPTAPPLPVPPGLVEAFWAAERARSEPAGDAASVAPGAATLAGDPDGLLVGGAAVAASRPPDVGRDARARRIVRTHVQVVDPEHVLVVAVTEDDAGARGQQTQLWALTPDGWRVTAEHVTPPSAPLDTRVWRVVGDPLVPGAPRGPLTGETVAVKDLFAVAGQVVGAGNPAFEAASAVERGDAAAVAALVEAGAAVRGIARTEEFAYGLTGVNAHHGTPPNPAAPDRLPGGSSSGSAAAVALGHATVGLGTDTAGSVRVPAAYQGLHGVRTTHGAVDRHGLLALAPTFDAIGWLTRSADLLALVGEVLLPPAADEPPAGGLDLVVVPELLRLADNDVAAACDRWIADRGLVVRETWPLADLDAWVAAFTTWQRWEAWQVRAPWLQGRLDEPGLLGPDVRARFAAAAAVTNAEAHAAYDVVLAAGARLRELLGDRVLVLPSAPTVAPHRRADAATLAAVRERTVRLTCLAPLAGAPAVSLPVATAAGLPAGVGLLAAPGRDRALLQLAVTLA